MYTSCSLFSYNEQWMGHFPSKTWKEIYGIQEIVIHAPQTNYCVWEIKAFFDLFKSIYCSFDLECYVSKEEFHLATQGWAQIIFYFYL